MLATLFSNSTATIGKDELLKSARTDTLVQVQVQEVLVVLEVALAAEEVSVVAMEVAMA